MFYRKHGRVYTPQDPVSATKQEHKDECDINLIMRSPNVNHLLIELARSDGSYQDLPDVGDFQQALAVVADANAAFELLPAKLRERYQNDPARFLSALHHPTPEDEQLLRDVGVFADPPDPAVVGDQAAGAPTAPAAPSAPAA